MSVDSCPSTQKLILTRSLTAALKSLGMIERTPSPSPEPEPEPKDPNDMSMEEMRAELLRNRVRLQALLTGLR
jgi:hypothetical protein